MNRQAFLQLATALLLGGLMGTPASAEAIFGSAAQLTSRDCSGIAANLDCVYQRPAPTRNYNAFLGGVGTEIDNTTTNTNGTWQVKTGANPGGLPVLKGGTWSGPNSRLNTNAVVFQQFTFTGPANTLFSMVGDLTWSFSGNDGLSDNGLYDNGGRVGEQAGESGIVATMYFMDPAAFVGVTTPQAIVSLLTADCSNPAMYAKAFFNPGDTAGSNPAGAHATQLKINKDCDGQDIYLNPGDTAMLVLALQTPSNRGGYSDATHTFVSNFDPELPAETLLTLRENFVPAAPQDVPEPASWALAAVGIACLRLLSGRRR